MLDNDLEIKESSGDDIEFLLPIRMEVLSEVFKQQRKELSDEEWNDICEENENYYIREIKSGGHIPVLAYWQGELAGCGGMCFYHEMPSPDNRQGKCAYLMNIYVRQQYRRRGIAAEICRKLIDAAKKNGAGKIYLESSEMAVELYRSLGFEDMRGYMKLENI